jgi:radical S-adenosyl methionine domain-containing protein 2
MSSSYLILDEYLCLLDKGDGLEGKSNSILKVGAAKALQQVKWDEESFYASAGSMIGHQNRVVMEMVAAEAQ